MLVADEWQDSITKKFTVRNTGDIDEVVGEDRDELATKMHV